MTGGCKSLDPTKLNRDKYDDYSSWSFSLEVYLEYLRELHKLHNDCPSDKLETKKNILCDYQLKTTDEVNISIGNVKELVPESFNKEKYVHHYKNMQLYLRLGLILDNRRSKCFAYQNSIYQNNQTIHQISKTIEAKKKKKITLKKHSKH